MSEKQPLAVYQSIVAITGALAKEGISKDKTNQQQGFKYRGIDQVYAALSTLLAEHHLCILPKVVKRESEERTSAKGGVLFYNAVTIDFDLVSAADGSTHTVTAVGEAFDSGDKSVGKAMSYAYKAMAFMLFAIPVEGQDNDPDANSHEVKPKNTTTTQNKTSQATTEDKPMAKVNQALYDELGAWCKGDETRMDTLLRQLSSYQKDDKTLSFGMDRIKTVSERWAGSALSKLRDVVKKEAQDAGLPSFCADCRTDPCTCEGPF